MKIEIDITEEQIEELRTNSYDHCFGKNSVLKQIIDKLPPKQKRWRFYKGNFSSREEPHNNPDGFIVFSVHRDGNHGEPAYCFTREQLEELFCSMKHGCPKSRLNPLYYETYLEGVRNSVDKFLSEQEVKD